MCDFSELKDFATKALHEIAKGSVEDVLRHLLSSRLLKIFPDSPWWVESHVLGTESHVSFAGAHGKKRSGFVDSIVGKTAIEYEKNLTTPSVFDEGFNQVREYCAALCNQGVASDEVLGVLSDTVRWYGYTVKVIGNAGKDGLLGAENIDLTTVDEVDLSEATDAECSRFEKFVEKYFARTKSRFLMPETLVDDFGVSSLSYRKHKKSFQAIVKKAAKERPDYFKLIQKVWQDFIAYLGASDYGQFSLDTYVDEFYLVTLAKILCANVLKGDAIFSEKEEAIEIANGEYFHDFNLENLVDYDYFGWLNNAPYVDEVAKSVIELQKDLQVYDFKHVSSKDLFGQLLAQLANKEHRLLLGQEFTPHWVAREVVHNVFASLDGAAIPRMLDMCSGSGVFMIEGLSETRVRYDISPEKYSSKKDKIIFSAVMGFDIDPLAVMLAKVNWVLAMRDLFDFHKGPITIPVYHADSLFMATPTSRHLPDGGGDAYVLNFYGKDNVVTLPAYLLTSEMRQVFDCALALVYKLAMMRASRGAVRLDPRTILTLVNKVEAQTEVSLLPKQKAELVESFTGLVLVLERLQRNGRNGIWSFILSNSYRPGLTGKQFNCVVSNPPWLAMSKFADNPYRDSLSRKAERYGIKPGGASHLHLELATTFLISAVDKYLSEGASWGCVMPGTVINGGQHEPLRRGGYRSTSNPVDMRITEIWDMPQTTFKNKAVVLFGDKSATPTASLLGGKVYKSRGESLPCNWKLTMRSERTAWVKEDEIEQIEIQEDGCTFTQGADIMPRTSLFHTFKKQANGDWSISPIEIGGGLDFLLDDVKKRCCADLSAKDFDADFVYLSLLSKHLTPFCVATPSYVILPAQRTGSTWVSLDDEAVALLNPSTSKVWKRIAKDSFCDGSISELFNKINILGKLKKQDFSQCRWLVLSSAGGANPCAAYVDLKGFPANRLVVDQTLYWHLAKSEDEAVYITGMLNSQALASAIVAFQPRGEFGPRHIHTRPYKITPMFDAKVGAHQAVVAATKALMREWRAFCRREDNEALLRPEGGRLNFRRKRLQTELRTLFSYAAYEDACRAAYNLKSSVGGESNIGHRAEVDFAIPRQCDPYEYAEAAHHNDDFDPNK